MTTQRVLWTACPHGAATRRQAPGLGGRRHRSCYHERRCPGTLAQFPDWEDWPSTNVSFKVKIGPQSYDADIVERGAFLLALGGAVPAVDARQPLPVLESRPPRRSTATRPLSYATSSRAPTRRSSNTEPVGGWPSFQLLTSDDGFGALPLEQPGAL